MSRLIVKNLPKNVTEEKLKEIFADKGTITDVQLKYTKDGQFRRFGFIGFKDEEEAKAAREHFNNSFIKTCKISVEFCAALGDAAKPQSWSKYAPDSKVNQVKVGKKADDNIVEEHAKKVKTKEERIQEKQRKIKEMLEKYKDDPLFTEFLETHTPKQALKLWKNDLEEIGPQETSQIEEEKSDEIIKQIVLSTEVSDKEYMELLKNKGKNKEELLEKVKKKNPHGEQKFFTVKVSNLGFDHKKKHVKQFFKPLKAKSIRVPPKKGFAFVGFKTENIMKQALMKNKSILHGRQIIVTKYVEHKNKASEENDKKNSNLRWKQQEEALKHEEDISESGRMFLRNLSYSVTEDDITKLFEKYGQLTEVNLPVDIQTRQRKGFGIVTFMIPEHAVKAYTELDGTILCGRMLHILPGKPKTSLEELAQEATNFKQKKELQRKANAGSSHNWNTLFLGQSAVIDLTAAMLQTSKEEVFFNEGGQSAAVRLAMGETAVVEKTRKFLEDNGVRLTAFNQAPSKRSKTVILVKNLPAETKSAEITDLFSKFGVLGRVILPPSGVTALVEFLEPSEARKAFLKLAYTKFKHLPLYLEWAPEDTFTTDVLGPPEKIEAPESSIKVQETPRKNEVSSTKVEENKKEEDDEEEPEPDTTLYIKNLNFSTTDDQLKKYFSKCGKLQYANVSMKRDAKNPGKKLSMGFGFVRYKYKRDADKALKTLQFSTFEGKTLELKRSQRTLQTDVSITKKTTNITEQTGTKILVRNVPFQATEKEIEELFKNYGELKAVRLPKKFVGEEKHRGFGFVEYFTKKDAKAAFKTLSQSTHLYGRRLVLEWAQKDENVDDIRKRTAKHFVEDQPSKKSKKSVLKPESIGLVSES